MNVKYFREKPDNKIPAKMQICYNRGIDIDKIKTYLSNTFDDINKPEAFGEELLKAGVKRLMDAISNNKRAFIIVDSDCDGMTSAALLINYLYELFPAWVENNLEYGLHEGKQHGINDFVDILVDCGYSLLLVPDAGTNDIEAIERLHNVGCETLILDHHLSDVPFSDYAITINSQYNYPNTELSGVGVVYKFCQYMDSLLGKDIVGKFKDLASTGLMGDMMSLQSLETKEMIFEGFQEKNIVNPLIYGLREKSSFALSKPDYAPSRDNDLGITPMGAAFFIIPLLNAICRSGTMEEKELVFAAMLTMKAFNEVVSNKRGHKLGEMERIVDQALRCCTNVKNRQTKAETQGMELLTKRAEDMLDNKVLVFCLEYNEIDPNIAGLVANKLASKYQRPVCVVRSIEGGYAGSMRGYTATGIDDFKSVAETSPACAWCRGHENAAGLCLEAPAAFVQDMNEKLKDISTEIVYYVDYIWNTDEIDGQAIIDMAEMNDYLGTGFARPQVYIKNCTIDDFMFMKEKHLKINLPGCSAIMWDAPEYLREKLLDGEVVTVNLICTCSINEWNWEQNPQLMIKDFEIIEKEITPIVGWGF